MKGSYVYTPLTKDQIKTLDEIPELIQYYGFKLNRTHSRAEFFVKDGVYPHQRDRFTELMSIYDDDINFSYSVASIKNIVKRLSESKINKSHKTEEIDYHYYHQLTEALDRLYNQGWEVVQIIDIKPSGNEVLLHRATVLVRQQPNFKIKN